MQSETEDVKDIEPSNIIEAWFHLINSISTHKKSN